MHHFLGEQPVLQVRLKYQIMEDKKYDLKTLNNGFRVTDVPHETNAANEMRMDFEGPPGISRELYCRYHKTEGNEDGITRYGSCTFCRGFGGSPTLLFFRYRKHSRNMDTVNMNSAGIRTVLEAKRTTERP